MNEETIARKIEQVEQITDKIKQAGSVVFVDYLGLTVEEITDLRVKLHKKTAKSYQNNILKRAAEKWIFRFNQHFSWSNAAFKDEVAASKVLFDFAKNIKLEVKIGVVDGRSSANELQTYITTKQG